MNVKRPERIIPMERKYLRSMRSANIPEKNMKNA